MYQLSFQWTYNCGRFKNLKPGHFFGDTVYYVMIQYHRVLFIVANPAV